MFLTERFYDTSQGIGENENTRATGWNSGIEPRSYWRPRVHNINQQRRQHKRSGIYLFNVGDRSSTVLTTL